VLHRDTPLSRSEPPQPCPTTQDGSGDSSRFQAASICGKESDQMFWTFLRFACACWLVFASCACPLWSTEANSNEPRYRASRWTTETGMPQNTVRCLVQTRDGYLWIGTRAGLARFDGVRFSVFSRATTPVMANDNCVALAEDGE